MTRPLAVIVCALAGLSLACDGDPITGPNLGEPVVLHAGQSALIATEVVEVGFTTVEGDSRCPVGVNCFWEGVAVVSMWARVGGAAEAAFTLHTTNGAPYSKAASVSGYRFELTSLEPQPPPNRSIPPGEYVLTLVVTREK